MESSKYVDPFHGNGVIDLPKPEGIAATWFFIKAQSGNTHPGACSPYGMVSACSYSGNYITGYGLNKPNTHSSVRLRHTENCASGFTHFQQCGTGAIETYYNYFKSIPLNGSLCQIGNKWELENEVAKPGYYSTLLKNTGIKAELTVSKKCAYHRYTFTNQKEAKIAIDFSNGGIEFKRKKTYPTKANIEILSDNKIQGYILMEDIPFYIYAEVDGDITSTNLWIESVEQKGVKSLTEKDIELENEFPFGVVFNTGLKESNSINLKIGFSLRSIEQAKKNISEIKEKSFDEVYEETKTNWESCFNKITVTGGTEEQKEIFYSNLYHSLIKPSDFENESPFTQEDGKCYIDFATMWDQYKTLLPLMLLVYPERGVDAVNAMFNLAENLGEFTNGTILSHAHNRFKGQARSLMIHTIADAFNYKLDGIDWQRAKKLILADIFKESNKDFIEGGTAHPFTHNLDMADACSSTARIVKAMGDSETTDKLNKLAKQWKNVYDPDTAKLGSSKYYEGGPWNYSFRLLHDMAGRIGLYKSEEDFIADLDKFFGYGQPPVEQPSKDSPRWIMDWGFSLNRFEGFNNEPDMETPYAYIYAGRHDKTAEIVRAGMKYLYTTGTGGLPGNDDSGGLSSCYVWNAIGLFPVTGQPVMLIGSPIFDSIDIKFGKHNFTVKTEENSDENIYIQSAEFDGIKINRAYLTIEELLNGKELKLIMGSKPSNWAKINRPPSYPEV